MIQFREKRSDWRTDWQTDEGEFIERNLLKQAFKNNNNNDKQTTIDPWKKEKINTDWTTAKTEKK